MGAALESVLSGAVGFTVGNVVARVKAKMAASTEKKCVHFDKHSATTKFKRMNVKNNMFIQCSALRSALCSDGRCSYHCKRFCKCEEVLR